jgi:hypothetical protein
MKNLTPVTFRKRNPTGEASRKAGTQPTSPAKFVAADFPIGRIAKRTSSRRRPDIADMLWAITDIVGVPKKCGDPQLVKSQRRF